MNFVKTHMTYYGDRTMTYNGFQRLGTYQVGNACMLQVIYDFPFNVRLCTNLLCSKNNKIELLCPPFGFGYGYVIKMLIFFIFVY